MYINKCKEDNIKYITIDFNEENINLIFLIISKFNDKYLFTFNCDRQPYIGIEEKEKIINSNIYEEIDTLINNYNNKNYYNELTDDLKLLIDIFKYTITDNTIEADDSDIGNMKYLNYYYVKDGNINTYTIVTNFGKYSSCAIDSGFVRQENILEEYIYKTDNIEEAKQLLSRFITKIKNKTK